METLWLTIGTLGFIAATVFFLFLMTRAPEGSRHFFIITAVITGVAAFFYLTMATGATSSLIEGRIFYWGRYLEWMITTPLLLLVLALLALAGWRRNVGFIAGLIALDEFMVLTGLQAGSSLTAFGKGFLFLILDFLAKIGFGFLLLTNDQALGEASGGRARASRVR